MNTYLAYTDASISAFRATDNRHVAGLGGVLLQQTDHELIHEHSFLHTIYAPNKNPTRAELLAIEMMLDVLLEKEPGSHLTVHTDCKTAADLIADRTSTRAQRRYQAILGRIQRKIRKFGDCQISYVEKGSRAKWHHEAHCLSRRASAVYKPL